MRKTALVLLHVKNLTSPSCSQPRFPARRGNFGATWTL